MLYKAREVKDKIGIFDVMRRRIRDDVNLSETGKQRARANLEESITVYRGEALAALAGEWREAREKFIDLQERGRSAAAAVEASYDYSKLAYHRQTAEALIAREREVSQIEALVHQSAGGGDKEKRRAWLEAWPVAEKRGAAGLAAWMRGELDRELVPATWPKIEADKHALLPQIKELHEITESVAEWYGAVSPFGIPGDFDKITGGVSVRSYAKDGEYLTEVSFSEPETAAV